MLIIRIPAAEVLWVSKAHSHVPVDAHEFSRKTDCHGMEERKSFFLLYGWYLSSTGRGLLFHSVL